MRCPLLFTSLLVCLSRAEDVLPWPNITATEISALSTTLVGYEECSSTGKSDILGAFYDSAHVLESDGIGSVLDSQKIDWQSPSAIEFLGSPFLTAANKNRIQGNIPSMAEWRRC